jgi:hypothetical protein
MSSGRDDIRSILLDVADSIRREPDPVVRAGLVDEFIKVTMRAATDLRDGTCYDLMTARLDRHADVHLPRWAAERRWLYARRWALRWHLPMTWLKGRPNLPGPSTYVEIGLPD